MPCYNYFRYPNEVDTVTWTWNQTHGAKSVLWLTLAQPFSRASVEFLPVYTPSSEEKENPTLYAANVSLCADFETERFFSPMSPKVLPTYPHRL